MPWLPIIAGGCSDISFDLELAKADGWCCGHRESCDEGRGWSFSGIAGHVPPQNQGNPASGTRTIEVRQVHLREWKHLAPDSRSQSLRWSKGLRRLGTKQWLNILVLRRAGRWLGSSGIEARAGKFIKLSWQRKKMAMGNRRERGAGVAADDRAYQVRAVSLSNSGGSPPIPGGDSTRQAIATFCPGKLLLTTKEAAESLGICEKTLWKLTQPRGDLPVVRIGTRVLYDPADLQVWIACRKSCCPRSPSMN